MKLMRRKRNKCFFFIKLHLFTPIFYLFTPYPKFHYFYFVLGKDGPLKCPNCSREFAYKTSLKQHLKKRMCERNRARQQLQQAASAAVNGGSAAVQNTFPPTIPTNQGSASTSAAVPQTAAENGHNLVANPQQQQQQTPGKQFKCPFCEKSYSWKQTLKQVKK